MYLPKQNLRMSSEQAEPALPPEGGTPPPAEAEPAQLPEGVIPLPAEAGVRDPFTALFEYYDTCNAMMDLFESFISEDTNARRGLWYPMISWHYGNMLRTFKEIGPKFKDLDEARKRLIETDQVAAECWKIPSFRSLMEGSGWIPTMVVHITSYASLIDEANNARRTLEDVAAPALGAWGLETLRYFQKGDAVEEVAPWTSCYGDVRYVLDRGRVRKDGKHFYWNDEFMDPWLVDDK